MQVPQHVIENYRELIIENSEDLSKGEEEFILDHLIFCMNMTLQTGDVTGINDPMIMGRIRLLSRIYNHSIETNCVIVFLNDPKIDEYQTVGTLELCKSSSRNSMMDGLNQIQDELLDEYWNYIKIEMCCSTKMYIYMICNSFTVVSESTFAPKICLRGRVHFVNEKTKELFHHPSGEYFPLSELTKEGDQDTLEWVDKNGNRYNDDEMLDKKRIRKLILEKKLQIDKVNIDIRKYENILESFDYTSIEIKK